MLLVSILDLIPTFIILQGNWQIMKIVLGVASLLTISPAVNASQYFDDDDECQYARTRNNHSTRPMNMKCTAGVGATRCKSK